MAGLWIGFSYVDSLERQALSSIAFELMCYKFLGRLRCYDLIVNVQVDAQR